jgi:glycosyltransferase involved in cell wall biosynthesis
MTYIELGDRPIVSIGMPIYNGQEYVALALESLLAQDFRNFELLISDNGSTDDTETICRRYAALDTRLKYVRQSGNYGAIYNFNFVLDSARGKYFMWASDHDLWASSMLSQYIEVLEAEKEVVLAYSRTWLIDRAGRQIELTSDHLDTRRMSRRQRYVHTIWNLNWCNMVYGLMRADAVTGIVAARAFWAWDLLFLAELSLHGACAQITEPLFFRRENRLSEDSLTDDAVMAARLDPTGTFALAWRSHDARYRQLRNAHLEMLLRSSLPPSEKAWTMASTLLCYRHRFGVSVRGLEPVLKGLRQSIPDDVRLRLLNRLGESSINDDWSQ